MAVTVPRQPPRRRTVRFEHSEHTRIQCIQCHSVPVSLEPEPRARACVACHDDHHAANRSCAACHQTSTIREAHARPVEAHSGCDQCHGAATVADLTPTRSFCLTCHSAGDDHYRAKQCTDCHFLESPESYRRHLRQRAAR